MFRAIAELAVIVGIIYLVVIFFKRIGKTIDGRKKVRIESEAHKRILLEDALLSNDYEKLDNWMILYGSETEGSKLEQIKQRRDDIYINRNG